MLKIMVLRKRHKKMLEDAAALRAKQSGFAAREADLAAQVEAATTDEEIAAAAAAVAGPAVAAAAEVEEKTCGSFGEYQNKFVQGIIDGNYAPVNALPGMAEGLVDLAPLSANVAEGTAEAIEAAKAAFVAGEKHVFDTAAENFMLKDGAKIESYVADVDDMGDYVPETEVVIDGYFHESEFRSAPYFDLRIDGINLLDEAY